MTAMKGSSEATSVMVQDKLEKTLDELEAVKEKLRLATVRRTREQAAARADSLLDDRLVACLPLGFCVQRGKTDAVAELEEARAKAEEFHSELARLQVRGGRQQPRTRAPLSDVADVIESCNVWPQVAVEEKETALDADRRRLAELEVRSASPPVPVIGLNYADGRVVLGLSSPVITGSAG